MIETAGFTIEDIDVFYLPGPKSVGAMSWGLGLELEDRA